MITPPNSTLSPSFTIESVHGLKETIVVGPNGIAPASQSTNAQRGAIASGSTGQGYRSGDAAVGTPFGSTNEFRQSH